MSEGIVDFNKLKVGEAPFSFAFRRHLDAVNETIAPLLEEVAATLGLDVSELSWAVTRLSSEGGRETQGGWVDCSNEGCDFVVEVEDVNIVDAFCEECE